MNKMSKNLFASDSEGENGENLEIQLNKEYAKSYNKFRQKELYQKLKAQDLNNSDSSSDDSTSSESSDDETDPKFDEEFFKALSSLKSKDPKIYNKEVQFFEDSISNENDDNKDKIKKNKKPLTLKDYERKVILEKNGKYSDDDEDGEDEGNLIGEKYRSYSPSYVEEQRQLKEEFQNILNNDESDEEFGGVFKKRQKTTEQKEQEETEFAKWLGGQKDDISEEAKLTLKPLKEFWTKSNLPKQEKFLRDYILNKGYKNTDVNDIPTYEEITGDKNLSEDEQELEKQEEFEHKYNFRYEEPDQEFIKRYPRTIDNSVRKTDDSRKLKRLEVKERKQKEKDEKMKQIEILKEMKKIEIEEKIKKLKEVTGNEELPFKDDELDEDFDPVAHDRRMQEIFNEDYYQIPEDEEKPECPDIDELRYEDWDNYDPNENENQNNDPHCEDDDFNMDCDYNPDHKEQLQNELIENTRRRGRKRRNRFMEIIKKEKPAFNPEDEKTYEEYLDEYYKLDCEDMIGDLPCRFKYIDCVPNDFGLTIEEILLAKNKELNQWASLKKTVQIRSEHVEKNEANMYKRKAQNMELKKKIFPSIYGDQQSDEEDEIINSTKIKNETIVSTSKNRKQEVSVNADLREKSETATVTDTEKLVMSSNLKMKKKQKSQQNKDFLIKAESLNVVSPKKPNNQDSKVINSTKIKNETIAAVTENKIDNKNKKQVSVNIDFKETSQLPIDTNIEKMTTKKKQSLLNKYLQMKGETLNISNTTTLSQNDITNEKNEIITSNTNPNWRKSKITDDNPFKNKKQLTHKINKNQGIQKQLNNKNAFKQNKFKSMGKKIKNDKNLSDERLKAYGLNPKKFNKKQNFLKIQNNRLKIKKTQTEKS